jgi:hypothetical protein
MHVADANGEPRRLRRESATFTVPSFELTGPPDAAEHREDDAMTVNKPIFLALVSSIFTGAGAVAAQQPAPSAPPPPQPQPAAAPSFGVPGTLVISSDANVGVSGSSISGGGSSWTLTLAPAADYFLPVHGLSIGGQISYTHIGGPAVEGSNTFAVGPRVGYNFSISDRFSVWPRVALLFGYESQGSGNNTTFDVQAVVPVLFHVDRHFFVGLGPGVQTDIVTSSGSRTTNYGLYFTLGGWTVLGS